MKTIATYYNGVETGETLNAMLATATQPGFMSAEDKAKLDSLTPGGSTGGEGETPVDTIEAAKVIEDPEHRFVTDADKTSWTGKAECIPASDALDGLMCKTDKVKLDGIEEGANKYVHPVTHAATDVTEDADHRFVTDAEKAAWNAKPDTKEALDLGNVTNDAQVKRVEMGVANGVATLDEAGKVPAAQLPGFVDDIEEFNIFDEFPKAGEAGKFYVDKAENKTYRWSGTQYTEITGGGVALGETSATAYAGDKGKAVTDEVNKIKDGTTVVPKAVESTTVNGHKVEADVPTDAVFTDTVYTHPDTHVATMIEQDETHRFVSDTEKAAWNAKAENTVVTGTANGLMIAADKVKLDGIETNANNYVHPDTHAASMVVEDATHRFITDVERIAWTEKAENTVVTAEANGLMSAEDKVKLDAIPHDTHEEPFFEGNSLYACGVGVTLDASETAGMNKVTWRGKNGLKSLEVPVGCYIYGGGYGKEKPVFYPSANITINGGEYRVIYGGNFGNGNIGHTTIVMNGGKLIEGINGGGAGYIGGDTTTSTGTVDIVINNTDSEILTVFGGSMGAAGMVGNAKITVNGGAINYLTAGGSNGHTSIGEVIVNGGTVKVLQGCNRGTMGNIKLTVNGGNIAKLYAGGETEDKNVTATYTKSEVVVNGGTIGNITAGTNGGVVNTDTVSGTYVDGTVDDVAASAMNLSKVTTLDKVVQTIISDVQLQDKVLVFKHGATVITSVDLTPILA